MAIDSWLPERARGQEWSLCFSSADIFSDNHDVFHAVCDEFSKALVMGRNSAMFEGYAAHTWANLGWADLFGPAANDFIFRLEPGLPSVARVLGAEDRPSFAQSDPNQCKEEFPFKDQFKNRRV